MGYKADLSQIPSLSHLEGFGNTLALRNLVSPRISQSWHHNHQLRGVFYNFVRLVDLAIEEYELGRISSESMWAQNAGWTFSRPTSHYETCVTATHRAILHLKAVRDHTDTPAHFASILPSPPSVLSGVGDKTIGDIRNAIQHLDERLLAKGLTATNPVKYPPIQPGEAIMLAMMGSEFVEGDMTTLVMSRLELGGNSVTLEDMASWLTELHRHASNFIDAWG